MSMRNFQLVVTELTVFELRSIFIFNLYNFRTTMPVNLKLNNGREIPPIGLGTFASEKVEKSVTAGIDLGYRLIDTAFMYRNEKKLGEVLSNKLKENKVERKELFISSKLWSTKHKPEHVIPTIKRSLADLQLDYLDLYLIHSPMAAKAEDEYEIFNLQEDKEASLEETWLAMEECVKQGYTRSIGVSNFNSVQVDRILKIATIKPVVNQVECNPYINQKKMIEFCRQRDILIMAFSPFYGMSKLGGDNRDMNMFEEPIIKELSKKYNKSAGQIILRFLVQLGTIPIPRSETYENLKENIDIFNFIISDEDAVKLESLNKNLRCLNLSSYTHFKEYPFAIEF